MVYVLAWGFSLYESAFEFIWKTWAKLDIWVFHKPFDMWVDLEVMLGGRKRARVIDWATILSKIKSNSKVKSGRHDYNSLKFLFLCFF